jgi:PadR family transcriptional regulator, regulatory protein AphA
MPKENSTRYALLGLIAAKPLSGYEMKKVFDSSLSLFWTESYGHIYPVLSGMAKEGLVQVSLEPSQAEAATGLAKKRYRITARGRRELDSWFGRLIAPQGERNELLLRLMLAPEAPTGSIPPLVEAERASQEERLGRARSLRATLAALGLGDRDPRALALRYEEARALAAIAWCGEALASLSRA